MTEKSFCVICDKDVEIVKVVPRGHYDERILSCEHIGRKLNLPLEERERETSQHSPYVAQSKTAEGEISISPSSYEPYRLLVWNSTFEVRNKDDVNKFY